VKRSWQSLAVLVVVSIAIGSGGPLLAASPEPSAASAGQTGAPRAIEPGERWLVSTWRPESAPRGVAAPYVVFLVRPDGSDRHALELDVAGWPRTATWTADGSGIAFVIRDGERPGDSIWTVDPDGSDLALLYGGDDSCVDPSNMSYSPDASHLALVCYSSVARGPSAVAVLDLATMKRTDLATLEWPEFIDNPPSWSPDGGSIAFDILTWDPTDSFVTGQLVATVPAQGGEVQRLTDPAMFGAHPDWSPDGTRLVFNTYDTGNIHGIEEPSNLYTLAADGSDLRQLTTASTDGRMRLGQPFWSPDGTGVWVTIGRDWEKDSTGWFKNTLGWVDAATGDLTEIGTEGKPFRERPQPASAGWTYLALGDSNVYGPAEACGSCTTYPHILADRVTAELGLPVRLIDGSQWNKLTAGKLLAEIQRDAWGEDWEQPRDPSLSPREAIDAADLITITVGANDQPWFQEPDSCGGTYDQACIDRVVTPYHDSLEGVLREIAVIRAGRPTAVLVTTLYNDMIAGPGHDPTWFYTPEFMTASAEGAKAFIDALDEATTDVASANAATVVDMHAVANGPDGSKAVPAGWFSQEFGDLNQAGQEAFADEIMHIGFAPLVETGD
jgi:lysophospholipase L1-like esterase